MSPPVENPREVYPLARLRSELRRWAAPRQAAVSCLASGSASGEDAEFHVAARDFVDRAHKRGDPEVGNALGLPLRLEQVMERGNHRFFETRIDAVLLVGALGH